MATFDGTLKLRLDAVYAGTADLGEVSQQIAGALWQAKINSGTSNGQADLFYSDTRTLAAGATEDLDLAGALTGPLGNTVTFAEILAIVVYTPSTNVGNIKVGGASANQLSSFFGDTSDKVVIQPDGFWAQGSKTAGYAVTAGTGDKLKVENADGSNAGDYTIVVIGRSA